MICNVCKTGKTLLGKVKSKIPNLSSDSGTSTGLSDVCWTRTTVGGPNYLGGSVTHIVVFVVIIIIVVLRRLRRRLPREPIPRLPPTTLLQSFLS
jgi:hypothetical protein